MTTKNIFIFILFLAAFAVFNPLKSQTTPFVKEINVSDTFPVPKENKNLLFYIQRTINKNTIIYEVNYTSDSTINEKDPVKIYWIRYSGKGEIEPLSYIQRNYAYGIESLMTDKVKKTFKLNLVSYNKRPIYLMKSDHDRRYHAYININNKFVYLSRAFARIDGGSFWVPHITYVELTGRDPVTGKTVIEKFVP